MHTSAACLPFCPPARPADPESIHSAVGNLDLGRARLLSRLSLFWIRRSRWAGRAPGCCFVFCKE